nr:hypothetical protein [Schwartzia sp. (in: firmicutes)]
EHEIRVIYNDSYLTTMKINVAPPKFPAKKIPFRLNYNTNFSHFHHANKKKREKSPLFLQRKIFIPPHPQTL